MGKVLVAGLVNVETSVNVKQFPVQYVPIDYPFFGVSTNVSGVGYNVAKALMTLGDNVDFLSIIGNDSLGRIIRDKLKLDMIYDRFVTNAMKQSANSVVLYDDSGKRRIFCDLKDLQEMKYPREYFDYAVRECTQMVICNVNFCRDLLPLAEKFRKEKPISTDVHAISDVNDEYNKAFMEVSDVVFLSHEKLPCKPEEFVKKITDTYGTKIVVCGLGADGALLSVKDDNFMERFPAVNVRPVVNTVGAGDALFSCFNHFYGRTKDPYISLKKAIIFAGFKIGESGASNGFMDERDLNNLAMQYIK